MIISTLFVSPLLGSRADSGLKDCNRLILADLVTRKEGRRGPGQGRREKIKGRGNKEDEKEEGKGTHGSTGCPSQIHLEPIIFIRLYCAIS
jgi:hypothetical protein